MSAKGRLQLLEDTDGEFPLPARKQPFASHHFKGLVVPHSAKSGPSGTVYSPAENDPKRTLKAPPN